MSNNKSESFIVKSKEKTNFKNHDKMLKREKNNGKSVNETVSVIEKNLQ